MSLPSARLLYFGACSPKAAPKSVRSRAWKEGSTDFLSACRSLLGREKHLWALLQKGRWLSELSYQERKVLLS